MGCYKKIVIMALCLTSFYLVAPANAVISEVQAINFGKFALQNNTSVHTYRVLPNGTINANVEYIRFFDGQEGQYNLSGYPATTALTILVTSGNLTTGAGGEQFSIGSWDTSPASLVTDASGEESFNLGATLSSSGSGTMYLDGTFNVNATITINF